MYLRQPKIGDFCLPMAGEKDIGWLQVAVDDPKRMDGSQALGDTLGDADAVIYRE